MFIGLAACLPLQRAPVLMVRKANARATSADRAPAAPNRIPCRDRACATARRARGRPRLRCGSAWRARAAASPAACTAPLRSARLPALRARCRSSSRCSCRARATATRPHARRGRRTIRTATVFAVASDHEVRRDLEPADRLEVRMRVPVERVGEQPLDRIAAVLARRQADRMQHDQVDRVARSGRGAEVRRLDPAARSATSRRARPRAVSVSRSCRHARRRGRPTFTPRRAMR